MTANPNAIPVHMRDMTDEDRKHIAEALDTVFTHLRDGTGQLVHEILQKEGWYADCEDCGTYISIDQLGDPCLECGHVNGDPSTGSTTDDVPMRVCVPCWTNQHHCCDHDPAGWAYCNCDRVGHPNVTVEPPTLYPRLRITFEPGDSHKGFPWVLSKVFKPEFPMGNTLNYYDSLTTAHTAATWFVNHKRGLKQ